MMEYQNSIILNQDPQQVQDIVRLLSHACFALGSDTDEIAYGDIVTLHETCSKSINPCKCLAGRTTVVR